MEEDVAHQVSSFNSLLMSFVLESCKREISLYMSV
jgi:hypothetical protein